MLERSICHIVGLTGECRDGAAEAARRRGLEVVWHADVEQLFSAEDLSRTGVVVASLDATLGAPHLVAARLDAARSPLSIVFIAERSDVRTIVAAVRAGANDVLACPGDLELLDAAIEKAAAASTLRRGKLADRTVAEDRLVKLSPGECDVLELMLAGKVNKSIAVRLGVALRTVEARRKRVFIKMGTRGLTEIAAMLNAAGVLQDVRKVHEQLASISMPRPAVVSPGVVHRHPVAVAG